MRKLIKGHYRMLTVLVIFFVILGTVAVSAKDNEEEIVSDLIGQRIGAMNGYFSSKISYGEAEVLLKKAESGRLLVEDLSQLKAYFRTDIEEVSDYQIDSIEFSEKSEDIICAVVEITWKVKGLEETETMHEFYSIICEKKGDEFKLMQFF